MLQLPNRISATEQAGIFTSNPSSMTRKSLKSSTCSGALSKSLYASILPCRILPFVSFTAAFRSTVTSSAVSGLRLLSVRVMIPSFSEAEAVIPATECSAVPIFPVSMAQASS